MFYWGKPKKSRTIRCTDPDSNRAPNELTSEFLPFRSHGLRICGSNHHFPYALALQRLIEQCHTFTNILTLKVTRHTVTLLQAMLSRSTQTKMWSIYLARDFRLWGPWPSLNCLELWNAGKAKKFSLIAKCQLAVTICRSQLHLTHASAICPHNWTSDLITSAISWQRDK